MKTVTPHEILSHHFRQKQKTNKNFSLRLLARKLDLSPSYTSKILRGLKPLPAGRTAHFAKYLSLDPFQRRKLDRALLSHKKWSDESQQNAEVELTQMPSERFKEAAPESFWLLEEWYYLPLLALIDCDDFQGDTGWISKRLGLSGETAARAWQRMTSTGVIQLIDGKWVKVQERMRFPNSKQNPVLQRYYSAMFDLSKRMVQKSEPQDFDRRLVLGASVSTNEQSYNKAKKFLEESLCRACEILDEGSRDQVYYLGVQLLPLTTKD